MSEPLRVLLVEDSREDELILLDQLRRGGYDPQYVRVDTAETMRAALQTGTWDLILADHAMPHFSGPAALQVLKESGLDVPYLVVSGTVSEEAAIELMRAGANDFIFKQKLGRLIPAIQRELREAQNRREKREAQAALARERAFLSSAIDMLPFPIVFNSLAGEVIRANRASHAFFGDLSPADWWQRQLLHAQTRLPVPQEQWPMMRAARGEVVSAVEGILVLPDGREVDVLAVAAPIAIRDGLVATVVAFMDITPVKEADRAKTRFLAVLSHELRTPLTNILGWARMAQETPEVVSEALRVIQRNAETQHRMLQNLLELTRWLHGRLDLEYASFDLWDAVLGTIAKYAPRAEERQVLFTTLAPSAPLPVCADRKRLRAVVENLLDNALTFTGPGDQVTVRGEDTGAKVGVVIQDTGHGIAPELLPHIFELFKVAPEVEQTGGGLGLGLPLARIILEAHSGGITISSPGAGQGSTVSIVLPRREECT